MLNTDRRAMIVSEVFGGQLTIGFTANYQLLFV